MTRCTHIDHRGRRCLRSTHWWGGHSYEPIPKIGAKRAREMVAEALFREAVQARADGLCEATGLVSPDGGFVCTDRRHPGDEVHHVFPQDRDAGRHDPDRGLFLCVLAHHWTTTHPEHASTLGLMRPKDEAAS